MSRTSKAWTKQYRNLFLQFTNLTRITSLLITTSIPSEIRSSPNSSHKLINLRPLLKKRKSQSPPLFHLFPLSSQQSLQKKSTNYQSTSRKMPMLLRRSHMCKPHLHQNRPTLFQCQIS